MVASLLSSWVVAAAERERPDDDCVRWVGWLWWYSTVIVVDLGGRTVRTMTVQINSCCAAVGSGSEKK